MAWLTQERGQPAGDGGEGCLYQGGADVGDSVFLTLAGIPTLPMIFLDRDFGEGELYQQEKELHVRTSQTPMIPCSPVPVEARAGLSLSASSS